MTRKLNEQRPIGYWLRRADELLTEHIDEAQHAQGINRLEWQALNVVRDGEAATYDAIADVLRPFADRTAVQNALERLLRRNVLRETGERRLEFTADGESLYATALAAQQEVRKRAMTGISEGEYDAAVAVLKRVVTNLEQP